MFQLCVILEPMQELMSKHKAHHLAPRDCLKTTLFHKWQRMIAPTPGKQGTFVCKAGTPMVERIEFANQTVNPLIVGVNQKPIFIFRSTAVIRGSAHRNVFSMCDRI